MKLASRSSVPAPVQAVSIPAPPVSAAQTAEHTRASVAQSVEKTKQQKIASVVRSASGEFAAVVKPVKKPLVSELTP